MWFAAEMRAASSFLAEGAIARLCLSSLNKIHEIIDRFEGLNGVLGGLNARGLSSA